MNTKNTADDDLVTVVLPAGPWRSMGDYGAARVAVVSDCDTVDTDDDTHCLDDFDLGAT